MEFWDIKYGGKGQRGSITLEASLFLVLFIVFYFVMMGFIQIARAQVVLQYAANEAAREISQYSYVLTKTGIVSRRVSTSAQAAAFTADAESLLDDIQQVGDVIASGAGAAQTAETVQQAGQHVYDFFSGPDALMNNIFALVKTKGADMVSSMAAKEITESIVKAQIENMSTKGADKYLKDLGIDGGMDGLDFSDSNWAGAASGGIPELQVSVAYTIDFHLGIIELGPRKFRVCAKTGLW